MESSFHRNLLLVWLDTNIVTTFDANDLFLRYELLGMEARSSDTASYQPSLCHPILLHAVGTVSFLQKEGKKYEMRIESVPFN